MAPRPDRRKVIDMGDNYPPALHWGLLGEMREFRNKTSDPWLIFYGLNRSVMVLPGERFIHMPYGNAGTKVESMA